MPFVAVEGRGIEDRTAPALVTWDGGGNDFNWNNALNWDNPVALDPNTLPGAGDDVVIDYGANDFSVVFAGGTTTIRTLTSRASLSVSGGTFGLLGASTIDEDLFLSARIESGASLSVAGTLNWPQGGFAGGGTVTVAEAGTLVMAANDHYLDGSALVSRGAPPGRAGTSSCTTGRRSPTPAPWPCRPRHSLYSPAGGGSFTNTGSITKTGGGQTFVGVPFANAGTLTVQAGSWYSDGGGTTTGSVAAAAGTLLTVYNHTLAAGSTLTSAGAVTVGNDTVAGTYSVTGTTYVNHGLTDFTGTVTGVGHTLTVVGTADFHATPVSVTDLTLSGRLQGTGAVGVAGTLNWPQAGSPGAGR